LKNEVKENDSVFIFHAGHGDINSTGRTAWITYEGFLEPEMSVGWFFHSDIRIALDELEARHVFLVSDSCYSGGLVDRERGSLSTEKIENSVAFRNKSREVMSSGAIQVVKDKSEFAYRLKEALKTVDVRYIQSSYLWAQIMYSFNTRTDKLKTEPILEKMPNSNHRLGGSFFFFNKDQTLETGQSSGNQLTPSPTQTVGAISATSELQHSVVVGEIIVSSDIAGTILVNGEAVTKITAYGNVVIKNIHTGSNTVSIRGENNVIYRSDNRVVVLQDQTVTTKITYRVGDKGPAGGYIFYDKGSFSDGWRYLEAAPADASAGVSWGLKGGRVSFEGKFTKTDIGSGKVNTDYMLLDYIKQKESGKAGDVAKNYKVNGFEDWFLPSRDELSTMYKNLKVQGIGNFSSGSYWSSNDHTDGQSALCINFSNGQSSNMDKNSNARIRAIRFF
jgi:hypothetical protein